MFKISIYYHYGDFDLTNKPESNSSCGDSCGSPIEQNEEQVGSEDICNTCTL